MWLHIMQCKSELLENKQENILYHNFVAVTLWRVSKTLAFRRFEQPCALDPYITVIKYKINY